MMSRALCPATLSNRPLHLRQRRVTLAAAPRARWYREARVPQEWQTLDSGTTTS